jgi:hypothetical protein
LVPLRFEARTLETLSRGRSAAAAWQSAATAWQAEIARRVDAGRRGGG